MQKDKPTTFSSLEIGINNLFPDFRNLPGNTRNPGKWLLRGESDFKRVITTQNRDFLPTSGELARYGVFLSACYQSLFKPNHGVIYAFNTALLSKKWLILGSREHENERTKIAKKFHLNISKIGDGAEAELIIAKKFFTFDPRTGIATAPNAISFSKISYIIVSEKVFEPYMKVINREVFAKIVLIK